MDTGRIACVVLLSAVVHAGAAQSLMYSPVAVSSPDLIPAVGYPFDLLYDHSGLSSIFLSGSTVWPSGFCSWTHSSAADHEFFSAQDPGLDTAHLILDMGAMLTWDRMAFFNEESAGFGLDPIRVDHAQNINGPWQTLCDWSLTDNPAAPPMDYPPDVLLFPFEITARYLRIRGSTPDWLNSFSVGEIILGTASPAQPSDTCFTACLPLGLVNIASVEPFATVDPSVEFIWLNDRDIADLRCFDHLGREMSVAWTRDKVNIGHLSSGAYVLIAASHGSTRTLRFHKGR
ncbi:MAG: hypothetical protein KA175_15480 [Flavobacteriales bacterium]|nr:hypothetical protein [Flavobacteriales bacterium]MBP6699022.1 hypothetical protein [Flavobacteriales bacterium]